METDIKNLNQGVKQNFFWALVVRRRAVTTVIKRLQEAA